LDSCRTKPTGMHYADFSDPELKGAIIVSGRKTIEPKIELKIESNLEENF
jgi:hypothetical protein